MADEDSSVRLFVALFDYNPVSMSPNPDAAEEELPFHKGQILKVNKNQGSEATLLFGILPGFSLAYPTGFLCTVLPNLYDKSTGFP